MTPRPADAGVSWHICTTCGKRAYTSRKTARRIARTLGGQGQGRLQAYRCGDAWHVGHIPWAIRTGRADRNDYRPTKKGPAS